MANAATSLTLGFVSDTMNPSIQTADSALRARIQSLGDSPSAKDMLALQVDMTTYNVAVETTSSIMKSLGDSIKSVARNVN